MLRYRVCDLVRQGDNIAQMFQITKRNVLTDKEDNMDMDDMTTLKSMQIYDNPINI